VKFLAHSSDLHVGGYPSSVLLALPVIYVPNNPDRRGIVQNQTEFLEYYAELALERYLYKPY
jgi:hypothetical protein